MRLFEPSVVCPICQARLPMPGNRLEHWAGHTFRIDGGPDVGGYMWICACGPSLMYWHDSYQASAGLAVHMLDLHGIAI